MGILDRSVDFVRELAGEPCTYGDNCPSHGVRHGRCLHCQARAVLYYPIRNSVVRTATAWELVGWDDGPIRIKGGRAVYDAVMFNCSSRGHKVKLARLDPVVCSDGVSRIREVSRYIDGDTVIEILEQRVR